MQKNQYYVMIHSGNIIEIEAFNARGGRNPKPRPAPGKLLTAEERAEHNRKRSEKRFIRLVNTNFKGGDLFVTLTYDNEHLPAAYNQARKDIENYIRRIRRINPNVKILAVIGRGGKYGRLHHHLLISGVSEKDIRSKWQNGGVDIKELRAHSDFNGIEYEDDFAGIARYLHNQALQEGNGRRWIQTKNLEQPEITPPAPCERRYSLNDPPEAPEGYELVDSHGDEYFGSGYVCFKYILLKKKRCGKTKRKRKAKNTAILVV